MILTTLLILVATSLVFLYAYLHFNPQFGGRISPADKRAYAQSPQWDGQKFVNQSETKVDVNLRTMPGLIRANLKDRKQRIPQHPLPVQPFNSQAWNSSNAHFQFIWYGHSVVLMKLAGKTILIDPMFGPDASPVGPVRTPRFSQNTLDILDTLPDLDAVFLTHDHYDHLDYASIQKLKGKVVHYYVALGVKRHLRHWGIPAGQITEYDWWDTGRLGDIQFTFTPSRHFSGRGLTDRTKCLWGGWAFITPQKRIYWSGDGGYASHFSEIGDKLGPFDWAFLECGQYYKLWTQVHQLPEEAVQAAIDVGAKVSTPVHWGAFKLAPHHWQDPVERFAAAAKNKGITTAFPELGQLVIEKDKLPCQHWWSIYDAYTPHDRQ